MSSGHGLLAAIDDQLSVWLSAWSVYTTVLAVLATGLLCYPLFTHTEPDIHPLLLARQAYAAPVRQQGESAVYRSLETPPSYPLKTGLNVKDPDTPRWAHGRDGDFRDVWLKAAQGELGPDGQPVAQKAKIITALGREDILEHELADVSRHISTIGQQLQRHGTKRVAIFLPNTLELLTTIFAAAFHNITPILLPHDLDEHSVVEALQQVQPDALIAAAGTLPLSGLLRGYPKLKQIIWVVNPSSRHMDWNEIPEGAGGDVDVSVWHDIIEDQQVGEVKQLSREGSTFEKLVTLWRGEKGRIGEVVEVDQKNLVAAIAAQITSLPPPQRLGPSDLFFPADSLAALYPLCLTLAAMFSHASIALNSVAGTNVDMILAMRGIAPTVVVASAESATKAHNHYQMQRTKGGLWSEIVHKWHLSALQKGRMPGAEAHDTSSGQAAKSPGRLRLIFISERVKADSPPLSSAELGSLRLFTGARIIYALTASHVAGAVTQTNLYDYRELEDSASGHSHFGSPVSSVEIKLVDTKDHRTTEVGDPRGQIFVLGPAVVGGVAALGVSGTVRDDYTLAYV